MEWKHCPLSKVGQLYVNENNVLLHYYSKEGEYMSNTTNNNICASVSSDTTDWDSINWNNIERYVDKQRKRIYKAEVNNDKQMKYQFSRR